MAKAPLFSIVIPCYNAKDEIRHCLGAALKSTYSNIEIVCVDDCSTDRTADIIREYPVRLVQLAKNSGAAVARNEGVLAAKGQYIVLLDSDAIMGAGTIQMMHDDLEQGKGDIIVANYSTAHPFRGIATNYKNLWLHYTYRILPRRLPFINTPCTAMRRDTFLSVKGLDSSIKILAGEDWEFGQRLCMKGYSIYLDKDIQFVHRKNFTLYNILRTDARKSFGIVKMHIRTRKRKAKIACNRGYGSTPLHFILSAPVASAILVMPVVVLATQSIYAVHALTALLLFYLAINLNFFSFLARKSPRVAIASLGIYYLNVLSVVFGGVAGLADYYVLGRRY